MHKLIFGLFNIYRSRAIRNIYVAIANNLNIFLAIFCHRQYDVSWACYCFIKYRLRFLNDYPNDENSESETHEEYNEIFSIN